MSQPTPPTSDAAPPTDALPQPPRPVTPLVRRRAWAEPIVRFLWLSAVGIAVAALYFLGTRYFEWRSEGWLITQGKEVTARVYRTGEKITGRPLKFGEVVDLRFDWNGSEKILTGLLEDIGERYVEGQNVIIRVDPADPGRWTNRTQTTPLAGRLIGSYFLGLAALVSLASAAVIRLKFLSLWKRGELHQGVVASHGSTALAPRSVCLRCQVPYRRDWLITTVAIPQDMPLPKPGDSIALLCNPHNLRQAIPLMTYTGK